MKPTVQKLSESVASLRCCYDASRLLFFFLETFHSSIQLGDHHVILKYVFESAELRKDCPRSFDVGCCWKLSTQSPPIRCTVKWTARVDFPEPVHRPTWKETAPPRSSWFCRSWKTCLNIRWNAISRRWSDRVYIAFTPFSSQCLLMWGVRRRITIFKL